MKTLMRAGLALSLLLASAPMAAADTNAALDRIVADAQNVRAEALQIERLLRADRPDLAAVTERLSILSTHAAALSSAVDGFDAAAATLTPAQRAAFDRARNAAATLRVFLDNKARLLADADRISSNRRLLRAKAEGIARRADIVEQQVSRMRG